MACRIMFLMVLCVFFGQAPAVAQSAVRQEQVAFEVDGLKVVGTFTRPENFDGKDHKKYPVILILHGMGGNRHGPKGLFSRAASIWAQSGVASLRISTRGRGGSEGDFLDMSLTGRVDEALSAVDWLRSRDDTLEGSVSVLGHSQGGIIAVDLAARLADTSPLLSIMLWAPNTDPLAIYTRSMGKYTLQKGLNAQLDEVVSWKSSGGPVRAFRKDFFRSLYAIDMNVAISRYAGPILVVVGRRDNWSTLPQSRKLLDHHKGRHDILQLDVDHRMGPSESKSSAVIHQTLDWLQSIMVKEAR